MKINEYVRTLKGVLSKEEALAALTNVRQDFTNKTMPVVQTATAACKVMKMKSPEVLDYFKQYQEHFRLSASVNVLDDLEKRMKAVDINLNILRESIEKTMPSSIAANNIDYRTASQLQLVDNASFLLRYLRRWIDAVIIYETEKVGMYSNYQKENLTKGEAEWVKMRFNIFLIVLAALSEDAGKFKKHFDTIPNVRVDTDSNDDMTLFSSMELDPFRLGFIPVAINPFFIVGKWIAEFQVWRYKEAKYDLETIQRRIMLLEEAHAGKANIQAEKELHILRKDASGLIAKLNRVEEDIK